MKTQYTVQLPDGTVASRMSLRPYTHAVIVVTTAAERDRLVAEVESKIAKLQDLTVKLEAQQCETDRTTHAAAIARIAYLQEPVTETLTRNDGSVYTTTHPRWISEQFKQTLPSGSNRFYSGGRDALEAAYRNRDATVVGQLALGEEVLARRREQLASAKKRSVGVASLYRWSMSLRGAQQGAAEVRGYRPLDQITITQDIKVRTVGRKVKVAS